jgi:hypothetical protein
MTAEQFMLQSTGYTVVVCLQYMTLFKQISRFTVLSWPELLTRARQSFMKRWDCLVSTDLRKTVRDASADIGQPTKFFFDPSQIPTLIQLMRHLLPEQCLLIQKRADQVCQHRFGLLGYEDLDYGPMIDWHLDIVNGKRAPRKVWFKVPYLNFEEVGDHKVIWELNRHQHLVTLAKAYCLTGDHRYVRELCAEWYHWNRENPYPFGINWSSSLEVSFRTLSWLWVRQLLENCPDLPTDFRSDLLIGIARNGRHISRYLSTYFSPNTHLIGEAAALFFVGTLCPQIRWAPEWKTIGWDILVKEAERQVQADGVYFEQSTYYHVYALDFFLHARTLAARNRWPIPRSYDLTVERMSEVLSTFGQNGMLPRFGDDDGGRLFDPTRNSTTHMRDPLSTAAVLFDRPDFKAASAGLCEETLWLLGADGVAKFAQLPALNREIASHGFESSGFYLMSSAAPRAQLVTHAGKMGALRAGHSHCDLLSLDLSIDGRECLIDSGTFRYASEARERNDFRGTSAHNTLRIDGLDQAEAGDAFSWNSLPTVRVPHWIQGRTFDFLVAEHSGYRRLASPATHRRSIIHLKPLFWFIRDEVEGEGRHVLEVFWHLVPGSAWQGKTSGAFLAVNEEGAEPALTVLLDGGRGSSRSIRQGWYSPAYGARKPSSVLELRKETSLPSEFATVLFPGRAATARLVALSSLEENHQQASVVGYRFEESGSDHYFFFSGSREPWVWQNWASDAAFVYGRINGKSELVHLALCNGSFAEMNGRRVFDNPSAVIRYEWVGPEDAPTVWRSDADHTRNDVMRSPVMSTKRVSERNFPAGSG